MKEKNSEKKYKKREFLVEKVERENEKKRRTRRGEMKNGRKSRVHLTEENQAIHRNNDQRNAMENL